jgi:hypothetical protein
MLIVPNQVRTFSIFLALVLDLWSKMKTSKMLLIERIELTLVAQQRSMLGNMFIYQLSNNKMYHYRGSLILFFDFNLIPSPKMVISTYSSVSILF